ncbi:MAG: tetratricopeptide repeat protein [Candidatus Limnocylindrales bacterium]
MTAPSHATRRSPLPRPRTIGVVVAALAIVGATYGFHALRPAAPVAPVVQVPAVTDPNAEPPAIALPGDPPGEPAIGSIEQIDHSIKAWTTNLTTNPKDFISATNLALLYHGRGRLSGDLADQTRALEAARTASALAPTETAARSLEASILYTLHDFSGSLAIADALYRAHPADIGSLATRADDELELGQTSAARTDYAAVAAAAPGPAVDVRLARLAYLTGDPAKALTLALHALKVQSEDPEADLGFYQYAVGEYARLGGDATLARTSYKAALTIRPTDFGALVGLAKVDAAEGPIDAAITGLEAAAAIVPQPETLTLLGDLQALRGDATAAGEQYATVRAIRQLSQLEGTVYDRQLALFELDHGGATDGILAAAQAGLATRTDAAGHDLVAWAAYRLGQLDLAEQQIQLARADGIVDARILEHAGAIAVARGDAATGDTLLRQALALGPALDPLATAEAQRLLGD